MTQYSSNILSPEQLVNFRNQVCLFVGAGQDVAPGYNLEFLLFNNNSGWHLASNPSEILQVYPPEGVVFISSGGTLYSIVSGSAVYATK